MHKVLAPLTSAAASGFLVIVSQSRWKCHSTAISSCCDAFEWKNIPGASLRVAAFVSIRRWIRKKGIGSMAKGAKWPGKETEVVYDSQNKFFDAADAPHNKNINVNVREKKELSCLRWISTL